MGIMNPTLRSKNKATVLEAFDTLFNRRDYAAAGLHSAQRSHSAGTKRTVRSDQKFTGDAKARKSVDPGERAVRDVARSILGARSGQWDMIQNEASKAESKSGLPMFGDRFGEI